MMIVLCPVSPSRHPLKPDDVVNRGAWMLCRITSMALLRVHIRRQKRHAIQEMHTRYNITLCCAGKFVREAHTMRRSSTSRDTVTSGDQRTCSLLNDKRLDSYTENEGENVTSIVDASNSTMLLSPHMHPACRPGGFGGRLDRGKQVESAPIGA
ncbi:hypothetical protein FA95DRAFT_1556949 [Auriscalpium vulgare]|uniref:Uncharacterized protein n=1 Tax=Auriscalpium vulgare TaxID=40419 RepID=A0ACB8S039_9AGAM|nr:hypothetical protein FA95DRAFT_1556949 [Auriscalpium vulgare]